MQSISSVRFSEGETELQIELFQKLSGKYRREGFIINIMVGFFSYYERISSRPESFEYRIQL